jgi:hypothetical protein
MGRDTHHRLAGRRGLLADVCDLIESVTVCRIDVGLLVNQFDALVLEHVDLVDIGVDHDGLNLDHDVEFGAARRRLAPVTTTDSDSGQATSSDSDDGALGSYAPMRAMRTTLRGVVTIAAPTTVVAALLYYFGWARSSTEAHALGLDDSLFGFSTTDYILRSISSMFWPLFLGAVALLVGLICHRGITVAFDNQTTNDGELAGSRLRFLQVLIIVLAVLGVLALVLGAAGAHVTRPTRFESLAAPVAVTVSVVLLAYAVHLYARYGWRHRNAAVAAELRPVAPLAWILVTILLLLSVFWSVSHYAGVKGVDLAIEVDRSVPSMPSVVVYSAKRLGLQPPVVETAIGNQDSAYRYMYTGLKLLVHSGHSYFLRVSDPHDLRNIVIADSPDIRMEFLPGGS